MSLPGWPASARGRCYPSKRLAFDANQVLSSRYEKKS